MKIGKKRIWWATIGLLLICACQQKMASQPSYRPLEPSKFFSKNRSARPLVPGTVAHTFKEDRHVENVSRSDYTFRTGKYDRRIQAKQIAGYVGVVSAKPLLAVTAGPMVDSHTDSFPFPITEKLLQRGQQRFNIYCSVCHDRAGTGHGMIVLRGYAKPPSFHIPRLRHARAGHFYDVMTNGFGAMPEYGTMVPPHDRWAIVAYIRALQLSQQATLDDVPAKDREKLLNRKKEAQVNE